MASIPELLDGHVTLEVECLDRLYRNGYIGPLATSGGLVTFMREQLGKPIPSPVVLGQVTEKFRESVKAMAERESIPLYQFDHKERKDDVANDFRRKRGTRDGVVFVGVAQEKAQAFQGKKIDGQFWFTRDKTVYVNHYYFYIDDADFGPLFLKVCSYAPWSTKLCLNGHEWAKRQLEKRSERESGRVGILRGFPDSAHGEEFEIADRQSLSLEQQVAQVGVAAPAIDEHPDVAIDGFHHTHADLGPAVVRDAVQVLQ